jgi:hypothetical protein
LLYALARSEHAMSRIVEYRHEVNVSLERVWSLVGDFGSILGWVVGGDEGSIELTGEGIGMTRDLTLPSVGQVQHRLDLLDPQAHRLTYSLTKGQPLGMKSYAVTVSLSGTNDSCTLDWLGEFEPEQGADVEEMANNLANAYKDLSIRLGSI